MVDKNSILYLSETFEEGQAYWSDSGERIVDLNDAYSAMDKYAIAIIKDFLKFRTDFLREERHMIMQKQSEVGIFSWSATSDDKLIELYFN